jgi:hypothetical protein
MVAIPLVRVPRASEVASFSFRAVSCELPDAGCLLMVSDRLATSND